jgi:hypothetical protein
VGAVDPHNLTCFEIDVADGLLSEFEWIEEGKGHREWLVPAELLNAKATYQLAGIRGMGLPLSGQGRSHDSGGQAAFNASVKENAAGLAACKRHCSATACAAPA